MVRIKLWPGWIWTQMLTGMQHSLKMFPGIENMSQCGILSFVLLGTCFSLQAKLVQQHYKRGVQQHDKDHRLGPYCSGNDAMCLSCPNPDVYMVDITMAPRQKKKIKGERNCPAYII